MKFQITKHNGHVTLGISDEELKRKPYLIRREDLIVPGSWEFIGLARTFNQALKILQKELIEEWHSNKEEVILFEIEAPDRE